MAAQNSKTLVHNKHKTQPVWVKGVYVEPNGFARVEASKEELKKHRFVQNGRVEIGADVEKKASNAADKTGGNEGGGE